MKEGSTYNGRLVKQPAPVTDTRAFVMKPYQLPIALQDQLRRCEAEREIKSRFN